MPDHPKTADDLKTSIREHYAERAVTAAAAKPCSCCGGEAAVEPQDGMARGLYAVEETGDLPPEAVLASLGCGNPLAVAQLREGERVMIRWLRFQDHAHTKGG